MHNIDIVLTWVDQNDPEWQAEKNKYDPDGTNPEGGDVRYRDWDNLQYVFRGIERFMPWVHRVFFVTMGHLPVWLNTAYPRLRIVKHSDFIPRKYLPTFNSNTIDLNIFRIQDLSERFIFFNDDTFVIKPVKEADFFTKGRPRDMACISPQPIARDNIRNIVINNLEILNDHFTIEDIRKNKWKWMDIRNYGMFALRSFLFMRFSSIIGIFEPHIPISFLRSTFEELWTIEEQAFDETCQNKFRTKLDINIWLARYWQLLSAQFEPRSRYFGKLICAADTQGVKDVLGSSKYKMVCINDDESVSADAFPAIKSIVNRELEKILPDPCGFENV